VAFIIPVMDHSYHFLVEGPGGKLISNTEVLPAPQANMLAAIIEGLMSRAEQPVLLYSLGGLIAIMLYLAGVPMLAFALGMYLPISITSAQLVGGMTAWLVSRSGKTEEIKTARREQGTLIASGIMAGAAIFGIISAVLRLPEAGAPIRWLSIGVNFFYESSSSGNILLSDRAAPWYEGFSGQMLSLGMFALLGVACFLLARKGAVWDLAESLPPANDTPQGQGGFKNKAEDNGVYRDELEAAKARVNSAEKEVQAARRQLAQLDRSSSASASRTDSETHHEKK
jgi:hypothetical protein